MIVWRSTHSVRALLLLPFPLLPLLPFPLETQIATNNSSLACELPFPLLPFVPDDRLPLPLDDVALTSPYREDPLPFPSMLLPLFSFRLVLSRRISRRKYLSLASPNSFKFRMVPLPPLPFPDDDDTSGSQMICPSSSQISGPVGVIARGKSGTASHINRGSSSIVLGVVFSVGEGVAAAAFVPKSWQNSGKVMPSCSKVQQPQV